MGGAEVEPFATRPVIMGTLGVVAASHYIAAEIGMHMLESGGNAADAAVATGFALEVLKPHQTGIGGECPILVYRPDGEAPNPAEISGAGTAPGAATLSYLRSQGIESIPGDGLLGATVPSAFGALVTTLMRYGRLGLRETLGPAVEVARGGFALYPQLGEEISTTADLFAEQWPVNAALYLRNGAAPSVGTLIQQPEWARTFTEAIDVELREQRRGREAALSATIDWFYRGPIADRVIKFAESTSVLDSTGRRHTGLLSRRDLDSFKTRVEAPATVSYRGLDIFKCGPWTQGPVFLQQLRLLETYDLASMGHNSIPYLHLLIEAAKLAFADRETYYGDPLFVDVPLGRLLSPEHAAERRRLIDPTSAWSLPEPGSGPSLYPGRRGRSHPGDTTHLDVIDRDGMMVSATPSGGWIQSSPIIPELGFPLGTRAQQFSLLPGHPNVLAPGKRPRLTLTPSLAMKDGHPYMVFGTPGGDMQDQWTLQFFLNVVDFEMDLQSAVDAPLVHSLDFPDSFYPHDRHPRRLVAEGRIDAQVRSGLKGLGHDVEVVGDWASGEVSGVRYSWETGLIEGAASPRGMAAYAVGR